MIPIRSYGPIGTRVSLQELPAAMRDFLQHETLWRNFKERFDRASPEDRLTLAHFFEKVAEVLWIDITNRDLHGLYRTISLQRLVGFLWFIAPENRLNYIRRMETLLSDDGWSYPHGSPGDPLPAAFADAVRSLPEPMQKGFKG